MKLAAAVLSALLYLGPVLGADPEAEINHLLNFISRSDCSFVRNGEAYAAADARKHIERKYGHTRRWVSTAEQFIEYTATESSVTGRPYQVICSGKEEASATWLLRELAAYRKGR